MEFRVRSMTEPTTTAAAGSADALLIENLSVDYRVRGKPRRVLSGLDLRIPRGSSFGLVGESGCGKSTAAYAAVGYLPRNGLISGGRILVDGTDLVSLPAEDLREIRAKHFSMVYQDPGRALNPSIKIGRQVAEAFEFIGIGRQEAWDRSLDMLRRVRIADPLKVMQRYPHQLSGGMQQRVCIAMALANNPSLLILDEPTTGLDATVEAEVLDLIDQLKTDFHTAILFISHNLGVVAKLCDRVGVLYAGNLVEEGPAAEIFRQPRHPYTVGLLRCLPTLGRRKSDGPLQTIPGFLPSSGATITGCVFAERCQLAEDRCRAAKPDLFAIDATHTSRCIHHDQPVPLTVDSPAGTQQRSAGDQQKPLLSIRKLAKTFHMKGHALRVLRDVELDLAPGETLGLVGESGSGKTTFARLLLGLLQPDAGSSVLLDGKPLEGALAKRSRDEVKAVQIVFQNPDSALNRSHSVKRLIGRAIEQLAGLSGEAVSTRLMDLLRAVRLADRYLMARPRQLSGGLKQRVAIARAFAGDPRLVVCDEPTSALDVSVQAAILNLLVDLQATRQVSYIFISHDLGVVRYLSDRIAVLYLGRLMEVGGSEDVFVGPHHPYTEALLSAIPSIDNPTAGRIRLSGEVPSAVNPPSGCVFQTRCPRKLGAICEQQEPALQQVGSSHAMACHIPIEELRRLQAVDKVAATGRVSEPV
jgi:peptide/nickel transport system ATP-binding protein